MKKKILILLASCLLLCGCGATIQPEQKQYTATFLELFDTVTTVIGRAESEAAFQAKAQNIRDDLMYYHRLFDIYNDYDGISNLKTINDNAGVAPVTVSPEIIDLLQDCKQYYTLTEGKVNVAMGSVLSLWHEARNDGVRDPQNAGLPDAKALEEAAAHTDIQSVQIDEAACTVYLSDPLIRLDVGAIAKGWATQRVAEQAPEGMLISVGGNVCVTGAKTDEGAPWVIGIRDPDDSEKNIHAIYMTGGTVVTSGDYQRTYYVEGKRYHHIIDPQTRMPATGWRAVSVVCSDSGLADALSTGLFLMDYQQGKRLAEQCGAEAFWIAADGSEYMTAGFESILRN